MVVTFTFSVNFMFWDKTRVEMFYFLINLQEVMTR